MAGYVGIEQNGGCQMHKADKVMAAMLKPITAEPIFKAGQTVRVLSRIDVNMPVELDYWLGEKCEVIKPVPRGLIRKEWAYLLQHPNGRTCEFMEYELDRRFKRRLPDRYKGEA